jgi:hypothetical protein
MSKHTKARSANWGRRSNRSKYKKDMRINHGRESREKCEVKVAGRIIELIED